MNTAHEELENFMLSQIQERKAELRGHVAGGGKQRDDVFSLLVRANEEDTSQEDGKKNATLSDQELVSPNARRRLDLC